MEKIKVEITKDISLVDNGIPYLVTDTFELWHDADMDDWIELFKKILYGQGFDPDTIDQAFFKEDEPKNDKFLKRITRMAKKHGMSDAEIDEMLDKE